MAYDKLSDYNKQRKSTHYKDEQGEDYLLHINKLLQQDESPAYKNLEEKYPSIFVFGLPRSGTTFMTQVIAHSFDLGYINNFMARFWLAPVTGIKLSKQIFGEKAVSSFNSTYAATTDVLDIHEFGYFWRNWLLKDRISDILNSKELEKQINWEALKQIILNMHDAFGKGWICKNIFGAYHLEKFTKMLDKSIFIYIERNPVDNAISILDARKKFYDDPGLWWSTVPMEYHELKDLAVEEQVAAQVHTLKKYYQQELAEIDPGRYIRVSYEEVCSKPASIVEKIYNHAKSHFDIDLKMREQAALEFQSRTYADRQQERKHFSVLLSRYSSEL